MLKTWKTWKEIKESCKPMTRRSARMTEKPDLLVKDSSTFLSEVKRMLTVTKVKRMFSLGTELFGAAGPFLEKPTWWNAGQAAFSMGKVLVDDVEVWADDYFAGNEWIEPYASDFNQTLLDVLQKYPYERLKASEDNTYIRICTLPTGGRVGWTYMGRLNVVDHIYFEEARLDETKDFVKQQLWQQFEGQSLVMRKNTRSPTLDDTSRVVFEIDNAFESKRSKRAEELAEQFKRPLSKGLTRSIMFYGPPGTGKSTLARTIVEMMGLRSFRVRIGDLGGLSNSTLFEAINIFQPDVVILDDFDRASSQAALLETLEFFHEKVKLVITTVNNRRKLDEALMRPGRIDIVELIDHMDEEVIKHVLGEYIDGYELVKDWPIAFINEYVKRRTYMTSEQAADSVKELTQRVERLRGYRDETHDDMYRMLKLFKKRTKDVTEPEEDDYDSEHDDPFDQFDG